MERIDLEARCVGSRHKRPIDSQPVRRYRAALDRPGLLDQAEVGLRTHYILEIGDLRLWQVPYGVARCQGARAPDEHAPLEASAAHLSYERKDRPGGLHVHAQEHPRR